MRLVLCIDIEVLNSECLEASNKLEDLVASGRAWEADLIGEPGALVGPNILVDVIDSMTGRLHFDEITCPLLMKHR